VDFSLCANRNRIPNDPVASKDRRPCRIVAARSDVATVVSQKAKAFSLRSSQISVLSVNPASAAKRLAAAPLQVVAMWELTVFGQETTT